MADSGRSSTSSSSSATQSETPEKKNYPGEEEKDSKGAEDCKNMKKTAEKDIKDDRKSRDADQMVKTSQKLDQNDTSGEFKKDPKEKPAKDAAPKQVPSSPPQTPRTPPGTPEPQTPTSADPPQPPRQPENEVFRSNLQVLLKNQNLQKAKSREYLERVEAIEAGTDDYKLNRKKEPEDEVVDCEEVREDHKMHDKEEKLQQNEKKKRKENKDKVTMEDGKKERRRSKGGEQEAEKKKDKDRKKSTGEKREDDKDKKKRKEGEKAKKENGDQEADKKKDKDRKKSTSERREDDKDKKTKEEEKVKKEEVIKKKEKKENHEEKPKPDERKTENKKRRPTSKEENYAAEKPKKDKEEKENKHAREKLKKVKEEKEEKPKKEDKQDSEKPTKEKQDRKAKEDNLKKEKIEERKEEKKNKETENETKEEEQKIKEKCEKTEKGLKEVDKDGGRLIEEKKREDGSVKKKKDEEKEEEKEEHHLPRVVGQDVKLEGPLYLKRKHHPFRRWKRYYFVLHGQLLTHYRSQQDYQQLSQGVKGSHDLATVLEVKSRSKSGVMIKSRKRFSLTRRNVASIHLAADTEEERSRWMTALEAVQQGSNRRLSELHRSEDVLAAPSTRHSSKPKSSTLPGRTKHTSSSSSSSSSEEDEEEEEQPKLIQPKKVLRVPIMGGGPLVGVNLGQVKLKQVKKEEQGDQQDDLTNETVKSKSSEKETDDEAANTGSLKKKSTAAPASPQTGELFGVKLKTLKKAGMELQTQDREGGQQEDASGSQTGQQKRPMKQAVIPLNTSGLLSRPDIHTTTPSPSPSPTPSPSTQKKSTVDRKKSPSPSLPISKSVQALTKSVEVVDDGQQADKATSGVVKENGDSNGALQHSLSINHASTSTITVDTTVELTPEIKTSESTTKEKPESPNKEQDGGEVSIPRVSITLKQDCSKEPEYEELDDLLLPPQTVEQVKAETRDGGKYEEDAKEKSNRKSSSSSSDSCPPPLPTSPIPASPYTSTRSPFTEMSTSESQDKKNVDCENEYEEFDENFLTIVQEAHKQAQVANKKAPVSTTEVSEENKPLSPPRSPYRVRSDTNESQGSSNKSDSEGDKKVKGFKIFQRKRSSSTISKNEEEDGSSRSMKDSVRKSSAITKFLSGKKKDKSKKTENIGSESPTEDHVEVPVKEKESSVQHTEEEAPVNTSTQDKQDTTTQVLDTKADEKWSSIDELLVEMRIDNLTINAEARCSSYSRTSTSSREQEPAPSIPEKTRLRAKSPNHDVPQSNRPVTAYHMIAPNSEGEGERPDGQPVDGYISEQQIEAILNKSQTRRASQTNSPGVILTGPDGKKRDAETAEDSISKRPSYVSLTSTESDDPLPMTNFSGDRASFSSGSSKERGKLYDSDGSGELVQENDGVKTTQPAQDDATPSASNNSVLLRKPARPTDGLTAGNRLSLTSKEFTVVEEDGSGSPETQKSTLPAKEPDSTQAENKKHEATESDSNSGSDSETGSSNQHSEDEEEKKNYFPTVGVELRQTRKDNLACPAYGADVRTSGIDGLKKCLKEMEEGDGGQDDSDSREIRRGISRLGHSPAMEKLKQTSGDL